MNHENPSVKTIGRVTGFQTVYVPEYKSTESYCYMSMEDECSVIVGDFQIRAIIFAKNALHHGFN
jgi:hypothetical protein